MQKFYPSTKVAKFIIWDKKTNLFDSNEISIWSIAGEFVVVFRPAEVDLWGTSGPASESSLVSSDRRRFGNFRA